MLLLQAIQFRYKEEFEVDQRLRAGFSAQQVKEVIPEAVFEVGWIFNVRYGCIKRICT